jgi:diguanylate cyclase (GGDEF)-like protein
MGFVHRLMTGRMSRAPAAPEAGAARTLVMRFIVTLIPAIFVVNILSASIIGFNAARVVKKELRTKQAELLKTRARLIAEPLWNLRYEGVAAALQDLNNDPNVLGVAVEDASGAVVTRLGQPEAADPSARLSIPIEYANADTRATIGNLAIAFDPGRAYLQIRDRALDGILLSLLSGIAVLVCVFLVTRRVILKPLETLSHAIEMSRAGRRRFKAEAEADGEIGALIHTFNAMQDQLEQDEATLRKFNAEFERLSQADPLTGKLNRAGFFAHATRRLGELFARRGIAVIAFIDLDRFKSVNDSFGHSVGDRYLRAIADRLDDEFKADGFVGRLGGDELAVFIDDRNGPIDRKAIADTCMRLLREPIEIDRLALDGSASVGLAVFPDDGTQLSGLLTAGDQAMYRAKSEGGDRCIIHDHEIAAQLFIRQTIESNMRDGLRRGWFDIAIQPIVDISTLRPVGAEVLARLRHPEQGEIPPSVFIPVAEESGQIAAIGKFVIEQALLALPELQDASGNDRFYLSVNLAPVQLSEQLPDDLAAILGRSGANVGNLVLEITESAIVGKGLRYDNIIGRLSKLGFRFALDDFGTGQSPLSYVDRFKIDIIKIDRSFIQIDPLSEDPAQIRRRGMLHAMVALGKELDIPIIAEGIETDRQLIAARVLGIELGQGYLFSRPLSVHAMASWLAMFGARRRPKGHVSAGNRQLAV